MSEDVVQLNFSLAIPNDKWLSKFSILYPQLKFNLLSMLLLSTNKANTLLQVKGVNLDQFWDEFSKSSVKENCSIIFHDNNSILLNMNMKDPWVLQTIFEAKLLLRFPITIHNGNISIELIGSREKINYLLNNNENWKNVEISIKQVKKYCPDTLLTPRQLEILTQSLTNGFFDIPRKKSLSDLAKEIGISPSALSENIRRINKKLAKQYINCLDSSK